jgi:hypothetical protein
VRGNVGQHVGTRDLGTGHRADRGDLAEAVTRISLRMPGDRGHRSTTTRALATGQLNAM